MSVSQLIPLGTPTYNGTYLKTTKYIENMKLVDLASPGIAVEPFLAFNRTIA